jgi:hypothetical protein
MKAKVGDLVMVEWDDSMTVNGWVSTGKSHATYDDRSCRSVGWLLQHSKDSLTLYAHRNPSKGELSSTSDPTTIPAFAVRSLVKLPETRKSRPKAAPNKHRHKRGIKR